MQNQIGNWVDIVGQHGGRGNWGGHWRGGPGRKGDRRFWGGYGGYGYGGYDPYAGYGGGFDPWSAFYAQQQMMQQPQYIPVPVPVPVSQVQPAPMASSLGPSAGSQAPTAMTPPAPDASTPAPAVQGWYAINHAGLVPGNPLAPRAALVEMPPPTRANRDILPMSTGVPILPTQSAQITGRPQVACFVPGRVVCSNAGTAGGAADWIFNDVKVGNVSQFVQSGDVPGDLFAVNAIDTFVRFAPVQTAMDFVFVVTYIGLNESGCPFFGAVLGAAAV